MVKSISRYEMLYVGYLRWQNSDFFNNLLLILMVFKQILGPPVAMATVTKVKKKSHIFVSVA